MEKKIITEKQFRDVITGVKKIRYVNGYVDDCMDFNRLKEQKEKLLTNFHNSLSTSITISVTLNNNHEG